MQLDRLSLVDFRGYAAAEVQLAPGLTAVVGANGQGKSNLLEAIGWLGGLRSFRGAVPETLVRVGAARAIVRGEGQREGRALLEAGQRDEGVAAWREALRLDPGNFTIRKQIWSVEHPDKFYPTIDFTWQGVQLTAEREAEIAAGVCGPDGCPLPWVAASAGSTERHATG